MEKGTCRLNKDFETDTSLFLSFSLSFFPFTFWRTLKLNPYGKMPLFTTGDDNIYESEVILQYILDKYADVGMNVGVSLSLSLSFGV